MKRVGFVFKIKAERLEEYEKHHRAVWPSMLDALRRHGWHNYSLFLRPDGTVFGYLEVPESFQAALEGMSKEEVNDRWQTFMAPFVDAVSAEHPDRTMIELEEVFHLD